MANLTVTGAGISIFLPGTGWCRTNTTYGVFFDGGWLDARTAADPTNRTRAAALHMFMVTLSGIATPRSLSNSDIADIAAVAASRARRAIPIHNVAPTTRQSNVGTVVAADTIEEPHESACAGYFIDMRGDKGASRLLVRSRIRLCRDTVHQQRLAILIVAEAFSVDDPDVSRRGEIVRSQLERIVKSFAFTP